MIGSTEWMRVTNAAEALLSSPRSWRTDKSIVHRVCRYLALTERLRSTPTRITLIDTVREVVGLRPSCDDARVKQTKHQWLPLQFA